MMSSLQTSCRQNKTGTGRLARANFRRMKRFKTLIL